MTFSIFKKCWLRSSGFILIAILASCNGKDPIVPINLPVTSHGVYILNEGNFGSGNGSIGFWDLAAQSYSGDAFKAKNGFKLGDVVQSMTLFNNLAYVVINNSGKIVVMDPIDFTYKYSITGFKSPRFFLPLNYDQALVSDLYDNQLAVVDLKTNTISTHISIGTWSERMLMVNGKVYVTCPNAAFVGVIDAGSSSISRKISVPLGSVSLAQDKNGKIWVACAGDSLKSQSGGLVVIDPETDLVVKTLSITNGNPYPTRLCLNLAGDSVFVLHKTLSGISINDTEINSSISITGNHLFYNLACDAITGSLFLSDAVDFVQNGFVFRMNRDGSKIDSIKAGLIPGELIFNK